MGYDYNYQMEGAEDVLLVFAGILLIVLLIVGIVSLVCYIFYSIGLHGLAKRRGLNHGWLAWLPIGRDWLLGCVSDQYQYVVKGKNTNRRLILLILSIAAFILPALVNGASLAVLVEVTQNAFQEMPGYEQQLNIGNMLTQSLGSLASAGVSIALLVFQCIALYDLYSSSRPSNNVLFLVLGILFCVTKPFFVFACRNKDDGMPPRREQLPQEPWEM